MPFTLAHPAAVLPLARRPLVPSALVAGSMAPDLPYYVSLRWIGVDYNLTLTHDVTSLLWLDPAIGLVLLGAFHLLLRRPVTALLPDAAARRLPRDTRASASTIVFVVGVLASVAIGAATHLAWDALGDLFGARLSARVNLAWTALGLLVLAGWLWRWWRGTPPGPLPPGRRWSPRTRGAWWVALAVTGVVAGTVTAVRYGADTLAYLREPGVGDHPAMLVEAVLRGFVIGTGTALIVGLGVLAVAWPVTGRGS